ncbi:MAG: hypothetical protein E6581_07635, partial [Cutibacterium granulosum]|nr:hypothetical protein [Cutibacterium granulosum]
MELLGLFLGLDLVTGRRIVTPVGVGAIGMQLGGIGLVMLGTGMALLAMLPENPSTANIVWRMLICGIGFGFFQAPNMKAIMSSAPPHRSGGASG